MLEQIYNIEVISEMNAKAQALIDKIPALCSGDPLSINANNTLGVNTGAFAESGSGGRRGPHANPPEHIRTGKDSIYSHNTYHNGGLEYSHVQASNQIRSQAKLTLSNSGKALLIEQNQGYSPVSNYGGMSTYHSQKKLTQSQTKQMMYQTQTRQFPHDRQSVLETQPQNIGDSYVRF